MKEKTYSDGIRESIEILEALQDKHDEQYSRAYSLVSKHIEDSDTYLDKVGKKIKVGDFMQMNPDDDDDWLDLVIRFGGNLILVSELTSNEPIRLKDCLQGSDNPSLIIGNLYNNRIEFFEW